MEGEMIRKTKRELVKVPGLVTLSALCAETGLGPALLRYRWMTGEIPEPAVFNRILVYTDAEVAEIKAWIPTRKVRKPYTKSEVR